MTGGLAAIFLIQVLLVVLDRQIRRQCAAQLVNNRSVLQRLPGRNAAKIGDNQNGKGSIVFCRIAFDIFQRRQFRPDRPRLPAQRQARPIRPPEYLVVGRPDHRARRECSIHL